MPNADPTVSAGLTESDWAEMSALMRVYENGGDLALQKAMHELKSKDPILFSRIADALEA